MNSKTKNNKILLPRSYLSWTQFSLFNNSPKTYKDIYILGKNSFVNKAMKYGKKLADALEEKEGSDDIEIDALCSLLPKYDVMEKEIEIVTNGVTLYGKLDSYNSKNHAILEYKTGRTPWTQKKVNKHGQLDFYASLVYLKYKVIPKIKLVWAETKKEKGNVTITGKVKKFKREIKPIDIARFLSMVEKTAQKISKMYEEEIDKLIG